MITQLQQGDVVLTRIDRLPKGQATPRAHRVLAEGEATGHMHRLTDASDGLLVEIEGVLYLSVGAGGAEIVHEEHKPVSIPAGEYRIGRVLEYSHFEEEARQVRD